MRVKFSVAGWLLGLALVLASVGISQATVLVAISDEDLARDATVIVEGTVAGIESVAAPGQSIYTFVTIDPSVILKGAIPNAPFVIKEWGGVVNDRADWLWGSPEYTTGEQVLLFLKRGNDGTLHTAQMSLGKFVIESSRDGDTVRQDLG